MGDPTARQSGRLTLNPLRHLDPVGSAALLLAGIGWAKPVPVDARNFRNPRAGMALTAAAGPLSNLLLGLLFMIPAKVLYFTGANQTVCSVVLEMCTINLSLGIFNLMPFPPFDGSRIYTSFLPEQVYFGVMKAERIILAVVLFLLWLGVFNTPLAAADKAVFHLFDILTGWVDRLFV